MSTNKRISGNYTIQTLNAGNQIALITSNVAVTGNLQVSGNIVGNNTLSAANATVTGNVTANFFVGNGSALTGVVASANIGVATELTNGTTTFSIPLSGGNIFGNINGVSNVFIFRDSGVNVAGYVSSDTVLASANITGGNVLTGGLITATGNITANFFIGNGSLLTGVVATGIGTLSSLSVTGNIDTGNLRTAGLVTATGNVTGGNILTAGVVTATGNVTGGNILTAGLVTATGNIQGGNILTAGLITATGNISGGNLNVTGNIVDTGALSIITGSNGNINLSPNGTGNVNITGNVMPTANVTANIGSAALSFNTIFAQATSAQYADLAECYASDADYAPGTVVMFGGSAEVTACNQDFCAEVAGVVSTNPAYKMNAGLYSKHVATVALVGRVPVRVQGPVRAGAMMVSAGNGAARAELNPAMGTVIGKAVHGFDGESGTIEIVVGRL